MQDWQSHSYAQSPSDPEAGAGTGTPSPGREPALHETGCWHGPCGLHTSIFHVTHFRAAGEQNPLGIGIWPWDRDLAMARRLGHRAGRTRSFPAWSLQDTGLKGLGCQSRSSGSGRLHHTSCWLQEAKDKGESPEALTASG